MAESTDFTRLLRSARDNPVARERLYALVYDELRSVARNQLQSERQGHTLQATALANEVYLKLCGQSRANWQNRTQFFAVAARATRRILVDHARTRLRDKRGGGAEHVELEAAIGVAAAMPDTGIVALDDALSRLKEHDPTKCSVVEMRYFAGLNNKEIADVLGISSRTVERHWRYAKAWLFRAMSEDSATEDAGQ